MSRIAVFVARYDIDNSPSIINLLDFLSESHEIDLFLRWVGLKNAGVLSKDTIHVIDLGGKNPSRFLRAKAKSYFSSYEHYICFDPHGFVLCTALFPHARPIYYSLELYMKDDHFGLCYPNHIADAERRRINDIKGLIIQSKEKESFFRNDYNLSANIPTFVLPVTYQGPSVKEKSDFIRKKYSIGSDKRIALHLGGIAGWHSCIEIAAVFSNLHDWVLLFQGHPSKEYLKDLEDMLAENNSTNVIVSNEIYDVLEDVSRVIMSCDLGIAWYNDISIGFRTAGRSSGKIAAYLQFGLPVIAKKYPSTVGAIEDTGCGVCVDAVDEVPAAVSRIEKQYAQYAHTAHDEYDKTYRFENYKDELIGFIEDAGKQ